jgi:hypothetical protein
MQELGTYIFTPVEKERAKQREKKRRYIDVNNPNLIIKK